MARTAQAAGAKALIVVNDKEGIVRKHFLLILLSGGILVRVHCVNSSFLNNCTHGYIVQESCVSLLLCSLIIVCFFGNYALFPMTRIIYP